MLDQGTQTAIDAAAAASAPDVTALTAAVASLAAASQQATGPFFATYPELLPLYAAYVASSDPVQDKRTALLASFLPILKMKRKQEQALAAITSAAGTDPGFATALLQDPTILHADADVTAARDHRPDGDREPGTVGAVLPRQRPGQPSGSGHRLGAGAVLRADRHDRRHDRERRRPHHHDQRHRDALPGRFRSGGAASSRTCRYLSPALAANVAAAINAVTTTDPVTGAAAQPGRDRIGAPRQRRTSS